MEQGELLWNSLVMIGGMLTCLGSIVFLVITSRVFHNDIETVGVVIGFVHDSDGASSVVRYITRQGQEAIAYGSYNYELGQRVIVRYPPDKPEKGVVKRDLIESLLLTTGFFLLLAMFCAFVLIVIILPQLDISSLI